MSDSITTLTAITSLITSVAFLISVLVSMRRIKEVNNNVSNVDTHLSEVHEDVKTGNSHRTELEKLHSAEVNPLKTKGIK